MKLYLITGFLGAGKTTFLLNFIKEFTSERLFLIINEFGRVGVDGALLHDVGVTLAEVNNGSIFCACRLDKFEEALTSAVANKPDIILVEASGLADPTNVCKVLANERFAQIEYMGGVCLVDATSFYKVSKTAPVCTKQLCTASLALLNKSDLAPKQSLENTMQLIKEINPLVTIKQTTYGKCKNKWKSLIHPIDSQDEALYCADITLQKVCVTINDNMSEVQLNSFLGMLCESTYRMKGFVQLLGANYYIDCVGTCVNVSPHLGECVDIGQIVLLAGQGMPLRKSLKQAVDWYEKYIKNVNYG